MNRRSDLASRLAFPNGPTAGRRGRSDQGKQRFVYWETAVCGRDARAVARAIQYAVKVVGSEHVALGSDFDGATTMPFDSTGVPLITDALRKSGLSEQDIRLIMGENVVRVLSQTLPE